MCVFVCVCGGGGGHLANHSHIIGIESDGEEITENFRRDKERKGDETTEQSISLLYTPCLF